MNGYIIALDQGTTSSRSIIFDSKGNIVSLAQYPFTQIYPKPGWVEHDPMVILESQLLAMGEAFEKSGLSPTDIAGIGITNQRETTIVWDKHTGRPVYNAIVWQCRRTAPICDQLMADGLGDYVKEKTGLLIDAYFSGTKIKWILDNVEGARERAERGDLLFGNTDTWLVWNLTGGVDGGVHVTDVTNASRTLLMNIRTLEWDPQIAADMGIPMSMLPEIKSSSEVYGFGRATGLLSGTPIAGILGDQQAATFGQACFEKGMAKNTYGTGNFMLMNTGNEPVFSNNGLLTTVAYKIGDAAPVYALEGSVAMSGSLIQWLRDNLRMIEHAAESEELATSVKDSGGCYVVPAFSGLFAPHWRSDARGVIVGLTRYVNRAHIVRAALEATAFQTREVLDAMNADSGVELSELRVDGGMTANEFLMQFQADILGVPVIRPKVVETTALGAAYAAGIAVGFWSGEQDVVDNWAEDKRWLPSMEPAEVDRQYRLWKKAVSRTLEWVDEDVPTA